MASRISARLKARLAKVKLLLCDVDGVLTDGGVIMGSGLELKRFHVRDGLGLRMLSREGIRVGWISNRPSAATTQRAEELKIDFLHQASGSKIEAAESMIARADVSWREVCFIGDDIVDIGVMQRVSVSVAVADAEATVLSIADIVTNRNGGQGAVREVVELVLKAQNRWKHVLKEHASGKPVERNHASSM